MARGFDTENDCSSLAAIIKRYDYDFVCRYYGDNPKKCLTAREAAALSAAGVNIVTIWEDSPTADAYFSHTRGVDEGTSAYHAALLVGQPAGSAIYFAVDYDAAPEVIAGPIAAYFQGVADGFTACAAGAAAAYSVGVYGSGATCAATLGSNLARCAWLANADHWAGFNTFANWNLKQYPTATLFGMGVDLDEASDNYGAFVLPTS